MIKTVSLILPCLSACGGGQPDQKPNDAELGAFMNKLDADEKVGKDAALAKSREKENLKAADAELRLKHYSDKHR